MSATTKSGATDTEHELASLMVAYQQGDRAAGERLVRALSPQLYGFLAFRQLQPSVNEDVLQDCWLEIHRSRLTYQPGRPLLPWIYAIVRNVRSRALKRHIRQLENEMPLDTQAAVIHATCHGELWEVIDRLPESQRETLYLLKVAGLTLEETAAATRSSVGAVKQRAHRAYQTLRDVAQTSDKRPVLEREENR